MIKMVNRDTGTTMWVHESRKEEYLEAGHKLASSEEKTEKAKPSGKARTKK